MLVLGDDENVEFAFVSDDIGGTFWFDEDELEEEENGEFEVISDEISWRFEFDKDELEEEDEELDGILKSGSGDCPMISGCSGVKNFLLSPAKSPAVINNDKISILFIRFSLQMY